MNLLGFTSGDLIGLFILAVIIFVIIVALKFFLKMTLGVVKMGCLVGVLIMIGAAFLFWIF